MILAYNVYQEMVSEPLEINSVRFPLNLSGGREWQRGVQTCSLILMGVVPTLKLSRKLQKKRQNRI
mgnify:CR=1 FL=1